MPGAAVNVDRVRERALELVPARALGAQAVEAARRLRVLAILLALAGTVGNVLVYLAVGAGRSEWSRMVFDVAWVWAVTSLLLALAFVVRSAAALLTLEVVRAEIEVAPLATSANQHHAD